ncbi:MAG: Proposed peptidoglycan lipid II flippase MurJ, partial [uncultured Pseudonocardia sp.]
PPAHRAGGPPTPLRRPRARPATRAPAVGRRAPSGPGPEGRAAHAADRPGEVGPGGRRADPGLRADRPRRRRGRRRPRGQSVAGPFQQPDRAGQPGQPGHRLPAPGAAGQRARGQPGQQLVHDREHAAQHRLRVADRRDPVGGAHPAAGAGAEGGPRRRRPVHPAPADAGRHGPGPGHGRGGAGRTAAHGALHRRGRRSRRAPPDHRAGLPPAAADLLLRHRGDPGRDPQQPAGLRAVRLGAGGQQHRRAGRARRVRAGAGGDQHRPRADGGAQAAGAGHRHHAGHRRAGRGAAAGGPARRLPLPAGLRLGPAAVAGPQARRVGGRVRPDRPARAGGHPAGGDRRRPGGSGRVHERVAAAPGPVRHPRGLHAHRADAADEPGRGRRPHRRRRGRPVAGQPAVGGVPAPRVRAHHGVRRPDRGGAVRVLAGERGRGGADRGGAVGVGVRAAAVRDHDAADPGVLRAHRQPHARAHPARDDRGEDPAPAAVRSPAAAVPGGAGARRGERPVVRGGRRRRPGAAAPPPRLGAQRRRAGDDGVGHRRLAARGARRLRRGDAAADPGRLARPPAGVVGSGGRARRRRPGDAHRDAPAAGAGGRSGGRPGPPAHRTAERWSLIPPRAV